MRECAVIIGPFSRAETAETAKFQAPGVRTLVRHVVYYPYEITEVAAVRRNIYLTCPGTVPVISAQTAVGMIIVNFVRIRGKVIHEVPWLNVLGFEIIDGKTETGALAIHQARHLDRVRVSGA